VANKFIDTINTSLKKSFADVDVAAIAAVDPLYPPYPGQAAAKGKAASQPIPVLPPAAMESMKQIFGPR
jgi:hypothetical protein